jgi:transporter family protein
MKPALLSWQFWALLSAAFAALTAIFAKIGVENIGSDFATFIRTIVILLTLGFMLTASDQWQSPGTVSGRTYLFLVLSGLATGASWLCYFRALKLGDAARVAPIDKLSVVLVAVRNVSTTLRHPGSEFRLYWAALPGSFPARLPAFMRAFSASAD